MAGMRESGDRVPPRYLASELERCCDGAAACRSSEPDAPVKLSRAQDSAPEHIEKLLFRRGVQIEICPHLSGIIHSVQKSSPLVDYP